MYVVKRKKKGHKIFTSPFTISQTKELNLLFVKCGQNQSHVISATS